MECRQGLFLSVCTAAGVVTSPNHSSLYHNILVRLHGHPCSYDWALLHYESLDVVSHIDRFSFLITGSTNHGYNKQIASRRRSDYLLRSGAMDKYFLKVALYRFVKDQSSKGYSK